MTRAANFQPNWVSPPGVTITEILRLRAKSLDDLASELDMTTAEVELVLSGSTSIQRQLAQLLQEALGPSAGFWLQREKQYRESLALHNLTRRALELRELVSNLPVADMRKFGWISPTAIGSERAAACLDFFGVTDAGRWHERYRSALTVAAFRTTPTFEANPYAVTAWLRHSELLAERIKCKAWHREKFAARLQDVRRLTRIKNPEQFLPELTAICAANGVALTLVRAPKGCRASGATRFLTNEKAVIVLSARYRTDDQFWFTFFHEAAHLILHSSDALFLEDGSPVTDHEEMEANEFAQRTLVPEELRDELLSTQPTLRAISSFARRVGISPGIVVGQLQHLGRVAPNRLNHIKRRYIWTEDQTLKLSL
jgi:HTH-type transcriptional regulator / antitoxin HigA